MCFVTWSVVEVEILWGYVEQVPVEVVGDQDVSRRKLNILLDGAALFILSEVKLHISIETEQSSGTP